MHSRAITLLLVTGLILTGCHSATTTNTEPKPGPTMTPFPEADTPLLDSPAHAEQELMGVIVRFTNVAFGFLGQWPQELEITAYNWEYWLGVPQVLILEMEVTNTSDRTINLEAAQGILVTPDEESVADYRGSDEVGGEFTPGVTKRGVIFIALTRTDLVNLKRMRYVIDGPRDDKYISLTVQDFDIEIVLEE